MCEDLTSHSFKNQLTGLCFVFLITNQEKFFNLLEGRASSFRSGSWDLPQVILHSFSGFNYFPEEPNGNNSFYCYILCIIYISYVYIFDMLYKITLHTIYVILICYFIHKLF